MEHMKPDEFTYQLTSSDKVSQLQSSSTFVPRIRSFLLRIFVITYKVFETYSKHTQISYEVKKGQKNQGKHNNYAVNEEGINLDIMSECTTEQTRPQEVSPNSVNGINLNIISHCSPKQLKVQEEYDIPLEVRRQIVTFYHDEETRRNRFQQGMDLPYGIKVKSMKGMIIRRRTVIRPIDSEMVYHIIVIKAAEEVEMYLTANRCALFWHAVRNYLRTYWAYILFLICFIAFIIGMVYYIKP